MNCKISGQIIEPCKSLRSVAESTNGSKRGINVWNYINMETGDSTRTIVGIVTKNDKRGRAFNSCPFCGTKYPYAQD